MISREQSTAQKGAVECRDAESRSRNVIRECCVKKKGRLWPKAADHGRGFSSLRGFLDASMIQAIKTGVNPRRIPIGAEQMLQNFSITASKLALTDADVKRIYTGC